MKLPKISFFIVALFGSTLFSWSPAEAVAPRAQTLSMCRGADGKALRGEVDFLLLLDNSKSLNQANGSDISNKRYVAIKDMLSSVVGGLGSSNKVNFALTSFGSRITDAISFGSKTLSTSSDAEQLSKLVREKVPGDYKKQEQTTDYVSALRHAHGLFSSRPDENCKIMVWFTDGVFEIKETRDAEEFREQAAYLRSKICGSSGIANDFQSSRINTFALVLEPKNADKARRGASYGAMAALTGDSELPETVNKYIRGGDDCGGGGIHLGEVLLATDASAIGRYMPGIANIASGAEQASEQCPVVGNEMNSLPLPAGRHLEWISVENIEGSSLPELAKLSIRTSTGNELGDASQFLKAKSSGSEYETKYELTERAKNELEAGWQINFDGGLAGLCLRAKAESFSLRFVTDEVSVGGIKLIGADKKSAIVEQDIDEMSFAINGDSSGKVFSLAEAATRQEEIVALLQIDGTKKIFSNPLEIRVGKMGEAVISCNAGLSFLEWQGTMPENKTVFTEFCEVNVSGTGMTIRSVAIDEGSSAERLRECGVELASSATKSNGELPTKGASNEVVVEENSQLKFQVVASLGDTARCQIDGVKVKLQLASAKAGESSQVIPLNLRFDLKNRASLWLVILFTVLGLFTVLALNLLALNYLMRRLIKLPSVNDLKAVEIPLVLARGQGGAVEATVNGEPLQGFRVSQENLMNVAGGNGETLVVQRGTTTLRMDRPGLFSPLRAPTVVIDPHAQAVYSPNAGTHGGLAPTFTSGLVFHSIRRIDDNSVAGILAAFIPMNGPSGGLRGAQAVLGDQVRIREIARRGMEFLTTSETNSTNKQSKIEQSISDNPPPTQASPPRANLPKIPGQSS